MTALAARLSAGIPVAVREWLGDPYRQQRLLFIASAVGYGIGLAATLLLIVQSQGGLGYDAQAYWLAGQAVLHGQPLYGSVAVDAFGAYKYPPLFAQLWAPFTLVGPLAFSWGWRIVCIASVRALAGSWRNVGLWLLVPMTIFELSVANVTFPIALVIFAALRGRRAGGWLTASAAALKFGPALVAPYLWLTRPDQRRPLLVGLAALAAAVVASYLLDPPAWAAYLDSLFRSTDASMTGFGVIALAPTGAADLALRVALAVAITAVAIWRKSDRLVFTATVIAVPILAIWRLAPLLVLPRLRREP